MKLSKKINYILLPVMISIFSIAGIVSYNSQKYQIYISLSEKIQSELRHISNNLNDAIRELEHVVRMSIENHAVQAALIDYGSQFDLYYLEKEIIEHVSSLHINHGRIISFGLLNRFGEKITYFNTSDPFDEYKPINVVDVHIGNVLTKFQSQNIVNAETTTYMFDTDKDEPELLIVKTFTPEQSMNVSTLSVGQELYTVVMRASVGHYEDFYRDIRSRISDNVILTLESVQASNKIGSGIEIEEVNLDNYGLDYRLKDNLWTINLSLPEKDLVEFYKPFQLLFLVIVLLVTIVTFVLLKWLIVKQIIAPVEKLTKQVEDAEEGQSIYIERPVEKDEVSILTNKYINLISNLDDLVKRDSLTGLPNRSKFNLDLARIRGRASRVGNKCAVIYFDLDNFKQVNDRYGHHAGDKLLVLFSERLVDSFVDFDWENLPITELEFARLSGDEFAIIVGGFEDVDILTLFTDRVLSLFDNGIQLDNTIYDIGVSIGISVYPDDAKTAVEMVNNADAAMYASKSSTGGPGYQFYSLELDNEIKKHVHINECLKESLAFEGFYLSYMPVFDTLTGVMTGAEVLLRTNHEKLLSYGPADYIPVAESSGLIKYIDYLVIDKALAQMSTWVRDFGYSGTLAINFSSWQLSNSDFVRDLSFLLSKYSVNPERIEMEVTETCFVPGDVRSIELLNSIKALGVRIALDDFGTGFTAFSQLIKYPVDTLKIDRSFVNAIDNESKGKQLFDLIVEIAKLYNLNVIAEGIENASQLEHVRAKGTQQVQGFYLSKPLAEDEFLAAWRTRKELS